MINSANLRKELRPPGVVSASCPGCVFFDKCGGIQNSRPLLNCFDQFCCGDGNCDNVCPYKSDFKDRLREVNGLHFDDIDLLKQDDLRLPAYIPLIHHRYRRAKKLVVPWASIELYDLFRIKKGKYECQLKEPADLRNKFLLGDDTRIVLRGTAVDVLLERYWSYRRVADCANKLTCLGVSLVIGPNFSTFLDVPRTDALFNRKRQLMCLSELSEAGISVVPHLSATMPSDWKFWTNFLKRNSHIQHVALNCQTGYKTLKKDVKLSLKYFQFNRKLDAISH